MTEVAQIRHKAGLTQKQLADLSGVAQPNIAAYENGTRRPSTKMLARLEAAARPKPSRLLVDHKATIQKIARRYKVLDILVFGSVARGEDHPGSDLDLLVRFAPDASIFDQAGLTDDLQDALGIGVDVVSEGGLRSGHDQIRREARAL